jgi:hypothetical protein
MTKDEAIAAADAIAKPTWDKPVKVGWHSSSADYGHITVDDNDICDVQFYGAIESPEPNEDDLRYFVESVRDTVALAEEVNQWRRVQDRLREIHEANRSQKKGDQGAWDIYNYVTEHVLGLTYEKPAYPEG